MCAIEQLLMMQKSNPKNVFTLPFFGSINLFKFGGHKCFLELTFSILNDQEIKSRSKNLHILKSNDR
jgi:hypothetical protein